MDSAGEGSARTRRVTDADVAREAGVSRATVYYVLNDDPKHRIPTATRHRVLDAVDRLGYVPFGPARLLRGGRSSVVILLTHGLGHATDLVATRIVTRLGAALEERGLHLVWQLDSDDSRDPSIDLAPVAVLSSAKPGEHPFDQAVDDYSVPVLEAFPGLTEFIAGAAREQVAHLVSRQRRTLTFVAPEGHSVGDAADIRWEALVGAAAAHRLRAPTRLALPWDRKAAGERLVEHLASHPDTDGLCAVNDEVAFTLLAAAHDHGLAVPDRVAVVGVDDHPFGRSSVPALTTVETRLEDFIGAFADQIARAGRGEPVSTETLPSLAVTVTRAST